jgi:type IV secretory pathway TraG/TraD family ATPase VirD4
MIPFFSAKFGPFITNTTMRNIIGQTKSAFNLRQVMDEQKVLMVNLSKGRIGDLNAQLLGLIMVSKINMAAMSRADMPEDQRKDFFLYVDEFQNFATDTFGEILSEARKYRLALIMAHQFIAQIGGTGDKQGK